MKCPVCGKEEFIETNLPFDIFGDASIRQNDGTRCYTCIACGYTIWFNHQAVEEYKEAKQRIEELDDKMLDCKKKIEQIKKESTDFSEEERQIKRFKDELKMRQKWGEDNKATRALIESIDELQSLISKGTRPDSDKRVANVQLEIVHLEGQKKQLSERFKLVKIQN